MEKILKAVEDYKNKQENIENVFEEFIMKRVFGGNIPASKELGKRVRVEIKDTRLSNSLGPLRSVTNCGYTVDVKALTREVSMDVNITFVYAGDRRRFL